MHKITTQKIHSNLLKKIQELEDQQKILDSSPSTNGAIWNRKLTDLFKFIVEYKMYQTPLFNQLIKNLRTINGEEIND